MEVQTKMRENRRGAAAGSQACGASCANTGSRCSKGSTSLRICRGSMNPWLRGPVTLLPPRGLRPRDPSCVAVRTLGPGVDIKIDIRENKRKGGENHGHATARRCDTYRSDIWPAAGKYNLSASAEYALGRAARDAQGDGQATISQGIPAASCSTGTGNCPGGRCPAGSHGASSTGSSC